MSKNSKPEKENLLFQKIGMWVLFLLFIGFTAVGLLRVIFEVDSFGINATRSHFQVKTGWQFIIYGILFFIGWIMALKYYKKNRITERTSE